MSGTSPQVQINKHGTPNGSQPSNSKTYSFSVSLTSGVTSQIDLRSQQFANIIGDVQGVFLDNSANATPFVVTFGSGQKIVVPPNGQAIMPIYVPFSTPVFSLVGNGNVTMTLVNFPSPAAVWGTSTGIVITNGLAQVQDPALEALISNNALSTSTALYGSGDTIIHQRSGKAYTGFVLGGGTTTIISGNPNCFVNSIFVTVDPYAVSTVATEFQISLEFLNAGNIVTGIFQSETTPITTPSSGSVVFNLAGLNLLGNSTGDTVQLVVSTGNLSNGAIRYTIIGGTTGLQ